MYNQEIKERFLRECASVNRAASYIDAIEEYEEQVSADLAQMSKVDAYKAIQNADIGTYGSAFSAIVFVRSYVKWCLDNRVLDNINTELMSVDVNDVDISNNMSQLMFANEQDFVKALRSVRPFDDGYYDVVMMAFAWMGIPQDQAVCLDISDVNFTDMTVSLGDKIVVPISENIGKILLVYSKTKTGSRTTKQGSRTVYRDDSYGKFVRKFSAPKQLGKPLTKSQIQSAVYELNNIYVELGNPPRFTNTNVLRSGALRRVFDLENSGVDVFLPKNKELVMEAFRVDAKLHEILWLYKNYKRALNL